MQAEYDEGGSIGKRYRRQDEIGTPWCVTVDHQTLEDRTVTLRDRDSLEQERVAIDELPGAAGGAARRAVALAEARRGLGETAATRTRRRRSTSGSAWAVRPAPAVQEDGALTFVDVDPPRLAA